MKFVHLFRAGRRVAAIAAALALAVLLPGCGSTGKAAKARPLEARAIRPPRGTNQQDLVIAPATSAGGRVASVNAKGRFVVIVFPIGQVPAAGTRMSVFHGEARTGEVRVDQRTLDNLVVADLLSGGALENDEVRAE